MRFVFLFISILLTGLPSARAATQAVPGDKLVLINNWLKRAPAYRLAELKDCACAAEMEALHVGYLPFFVSGRFDGTDGFAVMVVRKSGSFGAKIVVFSADEKRAPAVLQYPFSKEDNIESIGLFKHTRRNKPDELLVGTFGSEAELVRVPKR